MARNPYLVPTLATLRAEYDAAHPGRDKSFDGWIGDAAHAARKSEHNPDSLGRVRAVDITAKGAAGLDLAEDCRDAMIRRGQHGYVIHAGRICSSAVRAWTWRKYTGSNPHTHHVHVSALTQLDSRDPWGVGRSVPPRVTGSLDSNTVRLIQKLVGVKRDGDLGPLTVKGIQSMLVKAKVKPAPGKIDGKFGAMTARSLEAWAGVPATKVPGWYPGLIRGVQRKLADLVNAGKM